MSILRFKSESDIPAHLQAGLRSALSVDGAAGRATRVSLAQERGAAQEGTGSGDPQGMGSAEGWIVMKTCRKCGGTKPTSEFASDKSRADGLNVICRHCSALKSKAWREANGEANKQLCKAWYEKNKEKASANNKAWRAANAEKVKATKKKHQLANLDRCRTYNQNRRALIKSSCGKLSPKLAVRLLKLQRGKCACCKADLGSDYHLDHIMPLALGGSNTDHNIQILCPPCNQSKQARHPVDFMQSRGMLL